MKATGYTCPDCGHYVVPPQQYNYKTIELCRCLDLMGWDHTPVFEKIKTRPNDMAIELTIARLVRQDEARMPESYPNELRLIPKKGIEWRGIFARIKVGINPIIQLKKIAP